jgi:hypothetical protein
VSGLQREVESLRPVIDRFVSWPTDVLRPTTSLQTRLALAIAEETGKLPVQPRGRQWSEPEWKQVAAGIECAPQPGVLLGESERLKHVRYIKIRNIKELYSEQTLQILHEAVMLDEMMAR